LFIVFVLAGGQASRLSTLSVFAYQRSEEVVNTISNEDGLVVGSLPFNMLHGEWLAYTRGLAERYLIYFSPKMLFIDGGYDQRARVPDLGVLYYFSLILLPLGLIFLLKSRDKSSKFILLWLLLAPIPAVLSRDLISTLRALNMVIPIVILEAFGLYYILNFAKNKGKLVFVSASLLTTFLILANFTIYIDRYFVHAPQEYSKYWLYGYKQIFENFNNVSQVKSKIIVTDIYGQPYIYYLFYTKYSPEKFQKQAILDQPTVDVGTVRKIDNIEFRHIFWPNDRGEKNSLFIGSEDELPDKDVVPFSEFEKKKEVKFLSGEVALRMVETK
jgi:hypothetical protein